MPILDAQGRVVRSAIANWLERETLEALEHRVANMSAFARLCAPTLYDADGQPVQSAVLRQGDTITVKVPERYRG